MRSFEEETLAELEVGAVVDGTVSRITPYGAFLTLEGGKVGLVHISEIDRNYVKDVHDHLRESDVVQAKVIAIKEDGKIDLSIKALQDPAPPRPRRGGVGVGGCQPPPATVQHSAAVVTVNPDGQDFPLRRAERQRERPAGAIPLTQDGQPVGTAIPLAAFIHPP